MIRIAVYDDNELSIACLDAAFNYYVVNRNTEYDVSWFVGNKGLKKIANYASDLHMALVSINAEKSREFSKRLNDKNPNCRICYYNAVKRRPTNISNPLWFMDKDSNAFADKQMMAEKIENLFNGFKYLGNLLIFDTKQLLYIIPMEDVIYLQSDLKYVNIVCKEETVRIYKKLDEVEASLSNMFLRTHKSYVVNKAYLRKVDKANRIVVLDNGEELPISNSQYQKVLDELSPKI